MLLTWLFASLHLLALALGFAGVFARARELRGPLDPAGLKRLFMADAIWGVAAMLWVATGVYRLVALEKGVPYYMGSGWFHAKMGMFVLVLLLEAWPMITLIRWRLAVRDGKPVDARPARKLAIVSDVESLLVILMVFAAAAMARGVTF